MMCGRTPAAGGLGGEGGDGEIGGGGDGGGWVLLPKKMADAELFSGGSGLRWQGVLPSHP
jgi:hypothetical protein